MIKQEELRIGNWIYDRSTRSEEKTWSIRPDRRNQVMINDTDIEFINPVHITPEWLKRFGFIRNEKVIDGGVMSWEDGQLWLCYGQFAEMSNTVPCSFIHQLQNLYFALTGSELELKES